MQRREFLKHLGGSAALAQGWPAGAAPSGDRGKEPIAGAGANFYCSKLRCEYRFNPLGVGVRQPRLTWILASRSLKERGLRQTAFHILVASTAANLEADHGDLWDSGRTSSDESVHVAYKGRPLISKQYCYWKVRAWDQEGRNSGWSDAAHWSMGLLDRADWQAQWIADRETLGREASLCFRSGFQSETATLADTEKWVTIDLGKVQDMDSVKLYPAAAQNWDYTPGFLFPLRFKIEVGSQPDLSDATEVVDQRQSDVPDPGPLAQTYHFGNVSARYVRLTATRLRSRGQSNFGMALAEMQVLRNGQNLAQDAQVTASDWMPETGPWKRKYLVDGIVTSETASDVLPQYNPATVLRKTFGLSHPVTRATVFVTALGLYEFRINGQRVGADLHVPDWTNYRKQVAYYTYDVGSLLHQGENVIGATLGEGRYAGRVQQWPPRPYLYGCYPKLLLRLEVELADGQSATIVSDGSWRSTTEGPIRFSGIYEGEIYDARLAMPGWDTSGFDASRWRPAHGEESLGDAELVWACNEPIRVVKELKPVKLTEPKPGVYIYDLGQNIAGWCRLKVQAPEATTVTLRHGEMLNDDGTLYAENLHACRLSNAPAQTDKFVLRGTSEEVLEPHFTYHGFRYVELTVSGGSLSVPPSLETIVGQAFHSALTDAGEFECSSSLLNQLVHNIVWSQRGNLHSVPTDCPNRDERMGFGGDMQTFSQAAIFNMDMAAFFTKWVRDFRADQAVDGRYPDFAPDPDITRALSSAGWGDAAIIIPWRMYQNYGDKRMLEEHFSSAKRWIEHLVRASTDLVTELGDVDDWLNGDYQRYEDWPKSGANTPNKVFSTAFFAHSTETLAKMAAVIGRKQEAAQYSNLFEQIKASFIRHFVTADGPIEGDTQGGYALALRFNLLPEELRPKAIQHMLDAFKPYHGNLSTGIQASHRLLLELTRNGYKDEAYRLINLQTPPSWGYMIEQGATTIWERWDGYVKGRGFASPSMNSFNHFAFGSVGEWIYKTVLGINLDESHPAYKHFVLRPRPGGGLEWARGSYESIRGRIAVGWKVENGTFTLNVTIPVNTSATVWIPTHQPASVQESGKPAEAAPGVTRAREEVGAAVFEVAAGSYDFCAAY